MYPHRKYETFPTEELEKCVDLAIECRQRVVDQLAVMAPKEFGHIDLSAGTKLTNAK